MAIANNALHDELRQVTAPVQNKYVLVANRKGDFARFLNQILTETVANRREILLSTPHGNVIANRRIGVCISPTLFGFLEVSTRGQAGLTEQIGYSINHGVRIVRITAARAGGSLSGTSSKICYFDLPLSAFDILYLTIGVDESLENWEARVDFGEGFDVIGMSDDRLYQ